MPKPSRSFFDRDSDTVAQRLIGATLLVDGVGGIIVETEAYDPTDPASKSYQMHKSVANRALFGPPACAYVYFNYGLHWMLNFVCELGSGVLIRALEPTVGLERMRRRRGIMDIRLLCSGPARLSQALKITGNQDGLSLLKPPFELKVPRDPADIVRGTRIGLTKGVDAMRRYGLRGSPYVSKKFEE